MAGRDRLLDPVTGDYLRDGAGGYQTTTSIATAVYLQLKIKRRTWAVDGDAGSELHRVAQEGTGEGGVVFAKNAVKQALERFIQEGRARDLEVEAEGTANGRIALESAITDISAGRLDLSGLTRFNR